MVNLKLYFCELEKNAFSFFKFSEKRDVSWQELWGQEKGEIIIEVATSSDDSNALQKKIQIH